MDAGGDMFDTTDPDARLGAGLAVKLHDVGTGGGIDGERIQHVRSLGGRVATWRRDSVVISSGTRLALAAGHRVPREMNESAPLRARFGPFHIDEPEGRLARDGQRVELPPRALAVLCELVRRPNQLVTDELLLDRVWGHRHVSESVVRTVVGHLRRALGDDPRRPRYVETAARRGYRFVGEVMPDGGAPAPVRALPAPIPIAQRASTLVGRDAPAGLLEQAWRRVQEGSRQFVLVSGEAGIGKSALVDDFLATLPESTAVARSQCVEHYGPAEPYMPLLEALNALCRTPFGAAIRERLPAVAPTSGGWGQVLPPQHSALYARPQQTLPKKGVGRAQSSNAQRGRHRPAYPAIGVGPGREAGSSALGNAMLLRFECPSAAARLTRRCLRSCGR